MSIHNGYRGQDHYYLTILLDDGNTIELQTDPNHYAALTPGDSITVYTRDGALKIPYSIAE